MSVIPAPKPFLRSGVNSLPTAMQDAQANINVKMMELEEQEKMISDFEQQNSYLDRSYRVIFGVCIILTAGVWWYGVSSRDFTGLPVKLCAIACFGLSSFNLWMNPVRIVQDHPRRLYRFVAYCASLYGTLVISVVVMLSLIAPRVALILNSSTTTTKKSKTNLLPWDLIFVAVIPLIIVVGVYYVCALLQVTLDDIEKLRSKMYHFKKP
jgi:heme/copper-type cytochrome/quinol oxidase subunit 4